MDWVGILGAKAVSNNSPAPVRVRLRHTDLDSFIERFAPNVTRGGIFLASRTPRPVGDVLAFEVQLAGGQVALSGEGKVMWVKQFDPAQPQRPHGMGVQFTRIDPASRETLNRMLRLKGAARPAGTAGRPATTQSLRPVGEAPAPGTNGNGTRPHVDTSVDLAAEYGVDETTLRLTVERYRMGSARASEEEIEELLKPERVEAPTLGQALNELPRMLDPALRRRTGAFRTLDLVGSADKVSVDDTGKKNGPS
jgi:uncharacterized protein (TIGR02266 family)